LSCIVAFREVAAGGPLRAALRVELSGGKNHIALRSSQKTFHIEVAMTEPTKEELLAKIAELEKKAASGSKRTGALEFRVGEKGGVSVYGLGRFPVTLYYEQWTRLLDVAADLRAFLEENKHRLKLKTKDE
jgi:hypothetical protein